MTAVLWFWCLQIHSKWSVNCTGSSTKAVLLIKFCISSLAGIEEEKVTLQWKIQHHLDLWKIVWWRWKVIFSISFACLFSCFIFRLKSRHFFIVELCLNSFEPVVRFIFVVLGMHEWAVMLTMDKNLSSVWHVIWRIYNSLWCKSKFSFLHICLHCIKHNFIVFTPPNDVQYWG